jgi:rfaE bifunctional protein kinase chain/domain
MQDLDGQEMERLLSGIAATRVMVVGDSMLDHYIFGEVSRISPEAPVPILHVQKESFNPGGAANLALNLAGLGARVKLFSCWGNDESGRTLQSLLADNGIDTESCSMSEGIQTINKKRVVARNQHLCRIDYEQQPVDYEQVACEHFTSLESALEGCDAVIVSDYAKGFVSQKLLDGLVASASRRKVRVAIDPKPSRPLSISKPWLITPNYHESLALAKLPLHTPFSKEIVGQICSTIHAEIQPENLVITLGAHGMVLSRPDGCELYFPTLAREVCDVSGAGDTVIATLVAACAAGADLPKAIALSNLAAGAVVARLGTVPISVDLLRSAWKN